MKDPAVLFYTSDFLSGTMTMTNEEVGMYIRLLCLQHQKGKLTEKDMLSICKTYVQDVYSKFEKFDDFYYNQRMKDETEKRSKYTESRRMNAKKKKAYGKHMVKHMVNHMGNENENEIVNENKDVVKDINWYKSQFDEIYLDHLKVTFADKMNRIDEAIKESYLHLVNKDLETADRTRCRKLLNTWLKNMKSEHSFGNSKPQWHGGIKCS